MGCRGELSNLRQLGLRVGVARRVEQGRGEFAQPGLQSLQRGPDPLERCGGLRLCLASLRFSGSGVGQSLLGEA